MWVLILVKLELEAVGFVEEGNLENPMKTLGARCLARTNNKLNPHLVLDQS